MWSNDHISGFLFSSFLFSSFSEIDAWINYLQIGSFGAITRILSIVPSREDLLKLSAAGPLAGFAAGALLLILGFILPPIDGIGIVVDPVVFHESFLAGGLGE